MSDAFAREVHEAIRLKVHLLLAHEIPGARLDDEARLGCSFDHVISTTPEDLMNAGIYHEIAMNLSGNESRTTGLIALIREIGKGVGSSSSSSSPKHLGKRWKSSKVDPQGPVRGSAGTTSQAQLSWAAIKRRWLVRGTTAILSHIDTGAGATPDPTAKHSRARAFSFEGAARSCNAAA